MAKDQYIARLKSVPLFNSLSKKELELVLKQADHLRFPARHTVVREGSTGEEVWMVIEGELTVRRGGEEVAKLGPGDHFGELSVIDARPRDASVVATTPVELLVIGRRRFWAMLEGSPTLLRKVLVDLAGRLHDLDAADTKARLARSGPGSS
jgi:CRP/FNR family transcriptional regulator/CRP/FNR family cyclic AMP-dependent transcriptional regulator